MSRDPGDRFSKKIESMATLWGVIYLNCNTSGLQLHYPFLCQLQFDSRNTPAEVIDATGCHRQLVEQKAAWIAAERNFPWCDRNCQFLDLYLLPFPRQWTRTSFQPPTLTVLCLITFSGHQKLVCPPVQQARNAKELTSPQMCSSPTLVELVYQYPTSPSPLVISSETCVPHSSPAGLNFSCPKW